MKRFKVYGLGAALVDTELRVEDAELGTLGVEKGLMTLVDHGRRSELLKALDGRLPEAHHASGGSAGLAGNGTVAGPVTGAHLSSTTLMLCSCALPGLK